MDALRLHARRDPGRNPGGGRGPAQQQRGRRAAARQSSPRHPPSGTEGPTEKARRKRSWQELSITARNCERRTSRTFEKDVAINLFVVGGRTVNVKRKRVAHLKVSMNIRALILSSDSSWSLGRKRRIGEKKTCKNPRASMGSQHRTMYKYRARKVKIRRPGHDSARRMRFFRSTSTTSYQYLRTVGDADELPHAFDHLRMRRTSSMHESRHLRIHVLTRSNNWFGAGTGTHR